MALSALIVKFSDLRKRSRPDACATAEPQEERKTMTIPPPRPRRRKPLDAGPFAPEIGSFRLHLAAEGKAPKTVRTYTEAVAWFAASSGRLGRSRPGRRRGRRWPGPRHRFILDDQRRVDDCDETHPVRDKFPYPGKQSGGHGPRSSPGNHQAISFVWCA